MLRNLTFFPLGIATLLTLFLSYPAAAAPQAKQKKAPKRVVSSQCPLPQPRFSLFDRCLLDQQLREAAPPATVSGEAPLPERERTGLLPFIGKDRALTPTVPPERPAIAAGDPLTASPEQLVAGFTYSQNNRFFFNFGYSIPTAPLKEYIEPFGFSLTDEEDGKKISIGIDIAF